MYGSRCTVPALRKATGGMWFIDASKGDEPHSARHLPGSAWTRRGDPDTSDPISSPGEASAIAPAGSPGER
jgi:hypothetical protein